MKTIEIRRRADAPPEVVWAQLVDATGWSVWAGYDTAEVEQETGSGELRRLTNGEAVIRELVTVDQAGRRLRFEHLSGLPVHRYADSITLVPDGHGTGIEWRAEIEPLYQQAVGVVGVVRSVIEQSVDGLAAGAEAAWRRAGARGVSSLGE